MGGGRKHRGEAVILTTLSANGFPHHSFVAEDEWQRTDEATIAVAVTASSRTARNLDERRIGTLLFLDPDEVRTAFLRLKGRPGVMAADSSRRRYVFRIRAEVVASTPPGEIARLDRTFSYTRWQGSQEADRRKRVKEELSR